MSADVQPPGGALHTRNFEVSSADLLSRALTHPGHQRTGALQNLAAQQRFTDGIPCVAAYFESAARGSGGGCAALSRDAATAAGFRKRSALARTIIVFAISLSKLSFPSRAEVCS